MTSKERREQMKNVELLESVLKIKSKLDRKNDLLKEVSLMKECGVASNNIANYEKMKIELLELERELTKGLLDIVDFAINEFKQNMINE